MYLSDMSCWNENRAQAQRAVASRTEARVMFARSVSLPFPAAARKPGRCFFAMNSSCKNRANQALLTRQNDFLREKIRCDVCISYRK